MKTKLLSLCLSALICNMLPAVSYATSESAVLDTASSVAPNIIAPNLSQSALQALQWQPVNTHATQTIDLNGTSQKLNSGDIRGAIAAFALPANQGSLEITLNSLIKDKQVYAPNVLVLDEQLRPAAFYPSHYFRYQQPGIMSIDRLEGVLKLTPALGQQKIYLLIYTTHTDLQTSTEMVDPAKAYAQGIGNAVPNIPDPIARHTEAGTLTLKVKSERDAGNILIGQVFSTPSQQPVTVGSTQATSTSPIKTAPVAIPQSTLSTEKPVLNDTEKYFNDAIKKAINNGDIDKALKLLNEAERLGSPTARKTFIKMIKNKE
ncbi:maltose operon protein MalM [Xenorhabdus sp. Reich]|uniref:Maltose operon protein MalM n=1 Tax=Xenorhabdus littoralis TaxID=2582835 RepID=A0ABU4SKU5_9GAMM|nr:MULTISPECIES: maltose operon protein MalM [unclassified Xenorhabdus]MDX7992131.1 maltose operon protein MalM [Xenorhabdus sp. psl]MDX7999272.1 maltose operon protein MalM [Xenorhabdus sp. Reich]